MMNSLTKIGLMDRCIDGDREKFDQLFGTMYDPFSCFFNLLRENGVTQIPENITFDGKMKVAEFNIAAKIPLESKEQTLGIFDCKISVVPSKQATKVSVQSKR